MPLQATRPYRGVFRRAKPAAPKALNRPALLSADDSASYASLHTPPMVARFQLPQESSSISAKQIDETINLKDPEDAIEFFPSLFVRKRNDGDNQAVLATRMGSQFERPHADLLR